VIQAKAYGPEACRDPREGLQCRNQLAVDIFVQPAAVGNCQILNPDRCGPLWCIGGSKAASTHGSRGARTIPPDARIVVGPSHYLCMARRGG
jgi:hypothetical protein